VTVARVATVADAAAIAELLHAFNEEFDEPSPGPGFLAERLRALLPRDDVEAVVAEDPPIGIALLFLRPSVWHEGPAVTLDELYVRPERRGQGLGSAMIELAFALARERGAEWFELDTEESDVGARRFYERHGLSNGDDRALYYSKRL
jgi:GNAT superfamily N-acetyltransferase